MIKVTYEMQDKEMKKAEVTKVDIFDGRIFVRYNVPGKAEQVVKQMRADGRKGVLSSRGSMMQSFPKKTEEEILKIVEKDIENGILVAEQRTKRKFVIKNMVIEKQ